MRDLSAMPTSKLIGGRVLAEDLNTYLLMRLSMGDSRLTTGDNIQNLIDTNALIIAAISAEIDRHQGGHPMPNDVMTRPPVTGVKFFPVRSATRPTLFHSVTVNRATLTATACDCESGRHARRCWHKREVQDKCDVYRHVKAEWPASEVIGYDPTPCSRCDGRAFRVGLYVERSQAGYNGYLCPVICPACGIVRRVTL